MDDAWEALDIDDSDLPSLLRPCSRRSSSSSSSSKSIPHLPQSQTQSQPTVSTASFHPIPGPAGVLQAAFMHRKSDLHSPMSTQDCLRTVAQEGISDDDHDFKHTSWLLALDFARQRCHTEGSPLSSIRKCLNADRIPLVVAIIKSCTSNALGDLMVTLKDPTGTVGATIHHRVLTEGNFGKDISVGSVLILQKVTIFSPTRYAYYLNISLSNVVKVFFTCSGSPLQENLNASTVTLCPDPSADCSEKPWMPQNAIPLLQRRIEKIVNSVEHNANVKWSRDMDEPTVRGSSGRPGWEYSNNGSHRSLSSAVEKEPTMVRQDINNTITKAAAGENINNNSPKTVAENHEQNEMPNEFEIGRRDGGKQRQPVIFRGSLPEWTDEQLDELFAFDCENDGSLF